MTLNNLLILRKLRKEKKKIIHTCIQFLFTHIFLVTSIFSCGSELLSGVISFSLKDFPCFVRYPSSEFYQFLFIWKYLYSAFFFKANYTRLQNSRLPFFFLSFSTLIISFLLVASIVSQEKLTINHILVPFYTSCVSPPAFKIFSFLWISRI